MSKQVHFLIALEKLRLEPKMIAIFGEVQRQLVQYIPNLGLTYADGYLLGSRFLKSGHIMFLLFAILLAKKCGTWKV